MLLTLDLKRASERPVRSLGVPSGMSTARQLPDVSLSPRWRINPFTLHTHAHGRTNTRTDTDVHTFSHSPAFSPSLSRLSLCLFLLHSFPFAPSASSSGCLHRREKGGKARFAIAGSPPFFSHILSLSLRPLFLSRCHSASEIPRRCPWTHRHSRRAGVRARLASRPASKPCVVHR